MAAYASLLSLMRVIHDLETHPSPPISLDKQLLDSITQHITFFQQFLHSYISGLVADDDEEEAADPLEMRIAAAAHAAEDAIESHIVDSINCKKENDDEKCCGILQSVIEEMDSIKKVLMVVDTQTKQKPLVQVVHDQVQVPITNARSETLVGSNAAVLEIIMKMLTEGKLDFQVISIVGMGGIGKTFLAKTIYADPRIKDRFVICAWATISQHYDTREILCELLCQATKRNKEKLSGKSVDQLGSDLYKYLFSRRFLIVMDDMWSIESWDEIQHYFPDKGNGSRVLVTTRLSQLSLQLNSNDYSLQMSFLDKASSWELFSKTVFGEKSSCPPELEKIGEKIVENCRGLPLSISVVGGLLKKIDATRESWESIRDNFTSVVNMDNDKHCLRLLKLSYDHLPVYLKPCFLHMGVFEEDEEIRVSTLVQLWLSEAFLKPTNSEPLETTARCFLQDLVNRNLILTGELGSTGSSLKSCKIHDLVRDMCLEEGKKQGFYHVIGQCNNPPSQRRVVIHKHTSKEKVHDDLSFMTHSHTRSILCERGDLVSCWNMIFLRTLQTHKKSTISEFEICLNSVVFRFVNLRHVSIRASGMSSFLLSIGRLWNLQTLVVFHSSLSEPIVFSDFWKMSRFRHMEIRFGFACIPDPPDGDDAFVVMENLHTLKGIRNFKCSEGVVKRIPNIKRLKCEYIKCESDTDLYCVENMENIRGLESLSVNLYTSSSITPMQKITFSHSLKKLSLWMGSEMEWDDMLEKIGSLPLLEKLKLESGCFGKGEWEVAEGEFPCLKYLRLGDCRGLEIWRAYEEESYIFPRLEHLHLNGLNELEKIPLELGSIVTLKSIKMIDCGEGAVKSAKEMFDEQAELEGGEDELSFRVAINLREMFDKQLLSLAGPKFSVNV